MIFRPKKSFEDLNELVKELEKKVQQSVVRGDFDTGSKMMGELQKENEKINQINSSKWISSLMAL